MRCSAGQHPAADVLDQCSSLCVSSALPWGSSQADWRSLDINFFAQQYELPAGALAGAEADQATEGHRADRC